MQVLIAVKRRQKIDLGSWVRLKGCKRRRRGTTTEFSNSLLHRQINISMVLLQDITSFFFFFISLQGCRGGWFSEGETNWPMYYMPLEQCWLWYSYISNFSHHIPRSRTSCKVGLLPQVPCGYISRTLLWLK